MKPSRDRYLPRLREVFGGRRVRWDDNPIGDYDGRENTLHVFDADAREQLALLTAWREMKGEIEAAIGAPIVIIFHTRAETKRLYSECPKCQATSGDGWRLCAEFPARIVVSRSDTQPTCPMVHSPFYRETTAHAYDASNAVVPGAGGEFVRAQLAPEKDHVTLWIEGRDGDAPSVSAMPLDRDQVDRLIMRLMRLRLEMKLP